MHSERDLALGDSFYCANYVADARRGNGVTDLALVRGYHQTSGIRAERAFDRGGLDGVVLGGRGAVRRDRKSTRLNSSHLGISYAVFCLKKIKPTELILLLAERRFLTLLLSLPSARV